MSKNGKVINLEIDLTDCEFPGIEKMTPSEVTTNVLRNILYSFSKRGLVYSDRQMFYSLLATLDKADQDKSKEITVDDTQFGFLRKSQRESAMTPSKLLQRVDERLEEVKER